MTSLIFSTRSKAFSAMKPSAAESTAVADVSVKRIKLDSKGAPIARIWSNGCAKTDIVSVLYLAIKPSSVDAKGTLKILIASFCRILNRDDTSVPYHTLQASCKTLISEPHAFGNEIYLAMQDALITSAQMSARQLRASAMDRQREGGSSEAQAVGWLQQVDSTWNEWSSRVVSWTATPSDSRLGQLTTTILWVLVAMPCICFIVPRSTVHPQQGWTAFYQVSIAWRSRIPSIHDPFWAKAHHAQYIQD